MANIKKIFKRNKKKHSEQSSDEHHAFEYRNIPPKFEEDEETLYDDVLLHSPILSPPLTVPQVEHLEDYTTAGRRCFRHVDYVYSVGATNDETYTEDENFYFWDIHNMHEAQGASGFMVTKTFIQTKGSYDSLKCTEIAKMFNGRMSSDVGDLYKYITLHRIPVVLKEGNIKDAIELLKCKDSNLKLYIAEKLQESMVKCLSLQSGQTVASSKEISNCLSILLEEILENSSDHKVTQTLIHLSFSVFAFHVFFMDTDNLLDFKQKFEHYWRRELREVNVRTLLEFSMFLQDIVCAGKIKEYLCIQDWGHALRNSDITKNFVKNYLHFPVREKISYPFLLTVVSWSRRNIGNSVVSLGNVYALLRRSQELPLVRSYIEMLAVKLLKMDQSDRKYTHSQILDIEAESTLTVMLRDSSIPIDELADHHNKQIRQRAFEMNNRTETILRLIEEKSRVLDLKVKHKRANDSSSSKVVQTTSQLCGKFGTIKVLIPSNSTECDNEEIFQLPQNDITKDFRNQLDVLQSLHTGDTVHSNIVHLMMFQLSFPSFFITSSTGKTLLQFLLNSREDRTLLPESQLIGIILQIINAIDFLGDKAIVHRNITSKSFEVHEFEKNEINIKLADFELAKHLWRPGESPSLRMKDPDCKSIPILWSAPESLMYADFDRFSDLWMICITAFEIFEQGKWPILNSNDKTIDDVIKNVVFNERRPMQPVSMPNRVYSVFRDGLNKHPEQRICMTVMVEHLKNAKTVLGPYRKYTIKYKKMDELLPPLTERQIEKDSEPDRDIPPSILYHEREEDSEELIKSREANVVVQKTDITCKFNFSTAEQKDRTIDFKEQLDNSIKAGDLQYLRKMDNKVLGILNWPSTIYSSASGDNSRTLNYSFEPGMPLFDVVSNHCFGDSINVYILLLLDVAYLLDYIHEQKCIVNCLRTKNVWIKTQTTLDGALQIQPLTTSIKMTEKRTEKIAEIKDYMHVFTNLGHSVMQIFTDLVEVYGSEKVYIPPIGRFSTVHDREGDYDFVDRELDDGMYHWYAPEVIRNGRFSKGSDIYGFGRLAYEVTALFDASLKYYDPDILEILSTPFAQVPKEEVLQWIDRQYIPPKVPCCPGWLYREVIAACSRIERLDRPSLADIIKEFEIKYPHKKKPIILQRKVSTRQPEDQMSNARTSTSPPHYDTPVYHGHYDQYSIRSQSEASESFTYENRSDG